MYSDLGVQVGIEEQAATAIEVLLTYFILVLMNSAQCCRRPS